MASRRNSDDDDGGLDALLDTMTNVVGILVLVLIVTQMSVADVVDKIMTETKVDEEVIEKLEQQIKEKKQEEDELRKVLVDPLDIDAQKQREDLLRKKELLERRKKMLQEKKKQKNEFAMKMVTDRQQADQNKKKIANTEKQRKELQTLISTSLEKKASLEAMLDKTPNIKPPADIEITIPNPRPAPAGIKEAQIVCTNDQLYPVNIELFRKTADQRAKAIISRFNLNRDPKAGIDPKKFTPHFERLKDQDEFFDVEYFVLNNTALRLRLVPRVGRGASDKELLNPRSRIRTKWLNQLDVKKYYARFYVLPDGYNIYVTARRLFSDAGMLAGWEPVDKNWVLTTWVPGRLGPPPPPPKNPPPSKPAPPANVID